MAEVWYIALAGNVIAFLAVWWRLRNIEGLKVALAEQKKIAEELRQFRAEAHGEIWKLTGALNLFGPSAEIDLSELSRRMADWYFESGEALSNDVRDHYFILQEALGLCLANEIIPIRPAHQRIYGLLNDTGSPALVRLNAMRKAAFGGAAEDAFKSSDETEVESLRRLLNEWRSQPITKNVSQDDQFTTEERTWLLLQWLMSLLRSRLRAKLDNR